MNTYIHEKRQRCADIYPMIRADIIDSLFRYAYQGVPTGHFLTAVLTNDLVEAISRADHENLPILKDIVQLIYMELPSPCWKSKDHVTAWLAKDWSVNLDDND